MQISSSSRKSFSRGFTIIELVVSLAIVVAIMAAGAVYMTTWSEEARLKEASNEMETLAREAQMLAIMNNAAYRVVMTHNKIMLMSPEFIAEEPEKWAEMTPLKEYVLKDDRLNWHIIRWGTKELTTPTVKSPFIWVFPPEGFVEPIKVKFTMDKAYLQQEYHPLTASVVDEEMVIP